MAVWNFSENSSVLVGGGFPKPGGGVGGLSVKTLLKGTIFLQTSLIMHICNPSRKNNRYSR